MPHAPRLSIGALARQVGVSPQTLRHYHQLGILRPAAVTRAGYRLYSESDRVRLELVRSLRALDFDLDTIAQPCEGVGCDLAMLVLTALFLGRWGVRFYLLWPRPDRFFWP